VTAVIALVYKIAERLAGIAGEITEYRQFALVSDELLQYLSGEPVDSTKKSSDNADFGTAMRSHSFPYRTIAIKSSAD
jgi:hypothetical protein